jgi:3'-5' exoribonuclease
MKSPFVNELEANRLITTSFLVHSKEIRQKKGGELYLSLLLGDRTGELDAKMWDNVNDVIDSFDRDDFVKVKGLIQIFHNRPQLTIHKMRRMDDSEIEFVDYFPSSRRNPEEMWSELRGILDGIGNQHLKALLEAMFSDQEIARRYRIAPAAKQIHHAFLGGLLEHVLSLCALARMIAPHYANIDLDLLLAGVILHDIGKIYELNYERGFSYSSEGQLLGHIQIGLRMVADKLRGFPDFPRLLRTLLEHLIISHHGQLEFGSPKVPQFPEALLLHYLDDMDSKMECMRSLIETDRQVEGCFTAYNPSLERPVLKKDRYLNGNGQPKQPHAPAAPASAPSPKTAPSTGATESTAAPPADSAPGVPQLPDPASPDPASPSPPVVSPKPSPSPPVPFASPAPPPPSKPAPHPAFAPPPDSPFADKLKQALLAPLKQDS